MNQLVGSILSNKYEVLEVVGTGGMAVVYKGRDIRLGRNVAIKVLKPEFNDDKDFTKRFQTESMAIASLSHPNIVNVYDVGFEDELNYIVMELVSGKTLKEYLDALPGFMKEEAVINIGIQIGSALSQAHTKGVVHRDIKSQNILIDNEGRIKVSDFGIARVATDATIVKTTDVFGSVHYASPEQARGEDVDKRSDIYSFGILMYELITKQLPFSAETPVAVAMKQVKDEFPDPGKVNSQLSKGLGQIISICTQKIRAERYQNAFEVVADLRKLKQDPDFVPENKVNTDTHMITHAARIKGMGEVDKASKKIITKRQQERANKLSVEEPSKLNYIISALGGVVLALIVVAVIIAVHVNGVKKANTVEMPEIEDMDYVQAEIMLAQQGLAAEISEYRFSDSSPKGQIIDVMVDAGTKLKKGYVVKFIVSKGAEKEGVPRLIGLKEEDAVKLIKDSGFTLGNSKKKYSDSLINTVIEQSPKAGEKLAPGEIIDIIISGGKQETTVMVPSLATLSLRRADSTLSKMGLKLGSIKEEHNADYLKGNVIRNSKVGDMVDIGASIDVVVSLGPVPTSPTSPTSEQPETDEDGNEITTQPGADEDGEITPTTEPSTSTAPAEGTTASESTTQSEAEFTEKEFVIPIDTDTFEADTISIRIDFIDEMGKKVVYQAQHTKDEGPMIEIKLRLTGKGNARLLIYYDTFLKSEKSVDF